VFRSVHSSAARCCSSVFTNGTSVFAQNRKKYFHFCTAENVKRTTGARMDKEYKNALEAQKREMQIMLIRENHPVYVDFNFARYSDQKVAEMYKVLVENSHKNNNGTEAQTKV
jgi:hypothetical protein